MTREDLDFLPYDTAYFLDNDEIIISYLQDAMEESNEEFIEALQTVSRALGITELSKRTGLSRESIYKSLNGKTKPRYESIQKILSGLNLKLTVTPATPAEQKTAEAVNA